MINRSVKLRLKQSFFRVKNQEPQLIKNETAEQDITKLINLVHDQVAHELIIKNAWKNKQKIEQLSTMREHNLEQENLKNNTQKKLLKLKPSEESRQAGIFFKGLPKEIMSKSRAEKLCQDQLISKLKKWDNSYKTKPNAGHSINLGAVDPQMAVLTVKKQEVWLTLKAWDKELLLCFNISKKYAKADKVCLPNISINPQGKIIYSFNCQFKDAKPKISNEYVLGIDRGIKQFASWSVVKTSNGEIVSHGVLSQEFNHLNGKVKRLNSELNGIYKAIDETMSNDDVEQYKVLHEQLLGKKARLKALKTKLCQQASQELVTVSSVFDNCMIMLEDLSWAGNWKSRVPFGLLKHWLEHYAVLNGTHVQLVNAAYTSTTCSGCGNPSQNKFVKRDLLCVECGTILDRDINAAVNIARRGILRAVKSSVTRSKNASTAKRVRVLKKKKINIILIGKAGIDYVNHRVISGLAIMPFKQETRLLQSQISFCYRL